MGGWLFISKWFTFEPPQKRGLGATPQNSQHHESRFIYVFHAPALELSSSLRDLDRRSKGAPPATGLLLLSAFPQPASANAQVLPVKPAGLQRFLNRTGRYSTKGQQTVRIAGKKRDCYQHLYKQSAKKFNFKRTSTVLRTNETVPNELLAC